MYAGFLNNLHDTLAKVEWEKKDEKEMLNGIQETMNLHTKTISNLESVLNALADRVAVLENK
jgi:polyhydroxyalkanoate synthesis regulator phasin